MNDYQQKKLKNHVLPQPVYRQALWAVRDLERLQTRLSELKEDAYVLRGYDISIPSAGFGTGIVCDATASRAIKIVVLTRRVEAIESAFDAVPEKYRSGVRQKLVSDTPYNEETAHINTWRKWQQICLYQVAENLQLF